MSRPIVVVACMIGSSVSWEPQQHPLLWHSRAGGALYPSSRHTDVDKAAIIMPDRIYPGPKRWDSGVGPVAEQVSRTESEVVYCSVGEDHRPATKLRPLG